MESQKPRVSTSAGTAVSSSTGAYVYARTVSGSYSAGSFPIRAPLTIDDDDSGSESDFGKSASSETSSYCSRIDFDSDSDTGEEFESASPDPSDETTQEDASFGGIRVPMLYSEDPNTETGDCSGSSGRNRVYMPFVGKQEAKISVSHSSLEEEESEDSNEAEGVDESEMSSEAEGLSMNARIVIPRARLSMDDDETTEISGSEDEDNDGLLLRAKIRGYSGDKEEEKPETYIKNLSGVASINGECIPAEEDMMEMNKSDHYSISFGTVEEDSDELPMEIERSFGEAMEETCSELIEGVAIQGSIINETVSISDGNTCEADGAMNLSEDSENDCDVLIVLRNPEGEVESNICMHNSDISRMSSTQCSLTMVDHEVDGEVDVCVSDLSSTLPNVELLSEKEENQESDKVENKLSSCNGSVVVSELRSSIDNQTDSEFSSEENQISKIESLLPSGKCSVITDKEAEKETRSEWLIRDQIFVEPMQKERIENFLILKTKIVRIIKRLGLSADDSAVTLLSEEQRISEDSPDDIDLSINILVLGLSPSRENEEVNREIQMTIKKQMRTFCVDSILFIDQLDEHSGNSCDVQLLRDITSFLCSSSSSIWKNTVVILIHADDAAPDSSRYEDFISQRSSLLYQSIRQAFPELVSAGLPNVMPRVVLVKNSENLFRDYKTCGFSWRWQPLSLYGSDKIMREMGCLQKNETEIEKLDLLGSRVHSVARFCSLWKNISLNETHPNPISCLHDDFDSKMEHFLDSGGETTWDEQLLGQRSFEKESPENEEIGDGFEERPALGNVRSRRRRRRRRFGFQLKLGSRAIGVCIDTSGLKMGLSSGSGRGRDKRYTVGTDDEEQGRIVVNVRNSILPLLMSVLSYLYGRNQGT